jgi:arylsulfatase A
MRTFPGLFVLLLFFVGDLKAATLPNIVVILADDLGYGDVQCYNPERGKIPTPHIDRLALEGMRFTDAHTSSGVCSPTRYSLLTGRYHWRTRLQAGIVGYLEGPLIASDRLTVAGLLKQQSYQTAAFGKWHLGWDWNISSKEKILFSPGRGKKNEVITDAHRAAWQKVYSQSIAGGPTTRGFDQYFGTDVPNWPPFAFIENDQTSGIPTGFLPAKNFVPQLVSIQGPALAGWQLENVLPTITDRTVEFITEASKQEKPFFMYMPLTSPHTPIAVTEEWKGKSGLNVYADFVMETDAMVGRVIAALEQAGVADNTLVVFTSDNGCSPLANLKELESAGHFPSGPLRGYKASVWEGGHRVAFIVRWPGKVKAGTQCDQLVQQTDLMATFADVLGRPVPSGAGEDSVSLVPLLNGEIKPVREYGVSHSSTGVACLRKGNWKIIFGKESDKSGKSVTNAPGQLYDLASDLGETKNLWNEKPELVAELTAKMEQIVASHPNDVPVKWKRFLGQD